MSSRFETICMPVVVYTEQLYILWRDHCHKCIVFDEKKQLEIKEEKNPIEIGFENKEKTRTFCESNRNESILANVRPRYVVATLLNRLPVHVMAFSHYI